LSEEVHNNRNNEYDYDVDKLLERCTGVTVKEMDKKCSPKNPKQKYAIRKKIKEEDENRQRVHDFFMKREREWNELRRKNRKKDIRRSRIRPLGKTDNSQ
jgi:hypothetical protein